MTLDFNNIEEVPVEPGIPEPVIEEVIKQAIIGMRKVADDVTLLFFIIPGVKKYTFIINDEAANYISENIRPSGIVKATLADLPR